MDEALGTSPVARTRTWPWVLLMLLVGGLAWWRAVGTWFAQDDFRWLLRAAEGTPFSLATPRPLSLGLYFRAGLAAFGTSPVAFHALNLGLHLLTGALLFRVLSCRVSTARAAAGAAVFLSSPALFAALHWVSAITDLLCGACLALAAWLVIEHGRDRGSAPLAWLAVAGYALALLAKETAVGAAPALALMHSRCPDRGAKARVLVTLALAAAVALRASGAWQSGTGEPYALAPAAALLNLPAYLAAAVLGGAAYATPSDLIWARQGWVIAVGAVLLIAWLAALVRLNSPGAWPGFFWFLGVLAPVLFLERQFHFFYLYAALPGLVMSLALLVGKDRAAPGWARGAIVALVAIQFAAIEARATARLPAAPLPVDFVLRRAAIARNAIGDLLPHRDRLAPRVVMLGQQPVEAASGGTRTTAATGYVRDPWWDENVKAALADGEALRLMLPGVREVAFKPWLEAEDTSSTIAAYGIDGHLEVASYAAFAGAPAGAAATLPERLARAGALIQRRLFREALDELLAARRLAPDDADLLVNLGALQATLGDSAAALATLGHAVAVAPGDIDAAFNLGLLEWHRGRRDAARRAWAPLLERAPESDLARSARRLLEGAGGDQ